MEIREIKRITELLQKVNCKRIALIGEVAKEMGVKKTALMQVIEDNPKLFKLGEKVKRTKNTQTTLGLGIMRVYLSADENPDTEEWIEKMRKAWEKKIHIGELRYYNCHEYWIIPEEGDGKERKYRNTPEKIQELVDAGVIEKKSTCHGGWGDARYVDIFIFDDDVKKAIEDYGWTTDFDEVSANAKE